MDQHLMKIFVFLLIVIFLNSALSQIPKQNLQTTIVSLKFISPDDLVDNLLSQKQLSDDYVLKTKQGGVKLLINKSTNQILFTGDSASVFEAKNMIEFLDVAPRQIVVEAKIVELNNKKMTDMGIDVQKLLDEVSFSSVISSQKTHHKDQYNEYETKSTSILGSLQCSRNLGDFLKIIQEKGIGKIINIPKITTINNKTGVLLDGSHITYVARYSSFANIYETSELTAGLYLEVTPSLGDNEYLRLDVKAKLTTLGEVIGDSPSELGQQVQNTVIVKNGQEFLLGSFKKTEKVKVKRKTPLLGTIFPFLFSRTSEIEASRDFLVILKPTVIDLNTPELPKLEEN